MPTARNPITKAAVAMRRASYLQDGTIGARPERRLRGVRRLAGGALSAAERREPLAEARQRLVLGGALLVVDHQQPLRTRARVVSHPADRLPDAVGRDVRVVVAAVARLLGEHAGGGAAGAGLGVSGRAGATRPDHQLAMRATRGAGGPGTRRVALDEQEAVGAVRLRRFPCRGSIRLNHPCYSDQNQWSSYVPRTWIVRQKGVHANTLRGSFSGAWRESAVCRA